MKVTTKLSRLVTWVETHKKDSTIKQHKFPALMTGHIKKIPGLLSEAIDNFFFIFGHQAIKCHVMRPH